MTRLLAFLAVLLVALVPVQAKQEINFSILATESSENLMDKWEPFLADMSAQTGLTIKPFFADDYAGLIEAMRFDKVQAGWFSQKSGLEAVNRGGAEVFAQASYADGQPGYYSVVQVRQDSPIRTVDDLLKCDRTLDFGLGDPNSTSGYLVPVVYLFAPRGIDPEKCFNTVVNQNHEANALSVYNRRIDASANNTTNLKTMNRSRADVVAGLREVWRSPLLGLDPVVYRKNLDPAVKAKLRKFFAEYGVVGSPEKVAREREILASLEWGPFRLADNRILNQVQEIDLKNALFDMRNQTGPEADAKRQEIAAKIAALTGDEIDLANFAKPNPAEPGRGLAGWLPLIVSVAVLAGLIAWPRTRAAMARNFNMLLIGGVLVALVLSIEGAEMGKVGLLFSNGGAMGEYLSGFLRPDFSQWRLYTEQIVITVQIALWGTVLAVIFAVPFGLLSARNIAPVWIVQGVRRLMDVFRSINELVIATLFLVAVGPGPFAGVLALTVHTTGVLAKLFSEAVEAIDPGPVEGVRATGAGRIHEIVWGVVPQVLPLWASFALYRFESNARSSTVLGIIGAGGIGALLMQNIRGFYYDRTAAIVILMVIAVVIIDTVSQAVRKRLL
jgi:phosphonate ABC transporter permease subunit PhnE/phosphonate ABC transporter binding protein